MGILDVFRKKEPVMGQKRSYAAGKSGRLFTTGFGSSKRSGDAELQPALSIIRARSRELGRNNEYVKRYIDLLRNNVVGKQGFNMQVRAYGDSGMLDQNANNQIEKAYKKWMKRGNPTTCGKLSGVDLQKLILSSVSHDGDIFLIEHRGKQFADTIAFELVEADLVDEMYNQKLSNGNEIRMGIELDKFKKPVAYHFLQAHPGDQQYATLTKAEKYKRVPAKDVIHIMKPSRVGMSRGEPWLSSAVTALDQLGAFREAAIINARIGASKMGFFTSKTGDGFAGDDIVDDVPIMEVEPGTMHQLPSGVSFESFDPQYPHSEFDAFHKAVVQGIASAMGVSYAALSGDLSGTSFSSVRQGALDERDAYGNLQVWMIEHAVRPLFERWLSAVMEMGIVTLPLKKLDHFSDAAEFRGRGWSWVDPQKEMNSAVIGLKNGILSLSDVAAQHGKSVDEMMGQIDRDRKLAEQFGIKYAFEPYGGNLEKVAPEIADE